MNDIYLSLSALFFISSLALIRIVSVVSVSR